MTIEEGCLGIVPSTKLLLESDQLLTLFYFNHGHQPCLLKILWKSPVVKFESMTFPKGSPILPFFNYAFNKIRQTGALYRVKKKWMDKENTFKCQLDPLEPISIHKIVSLVVLLFFAICSTFIILAVEILFKKLNHSGIY